VIDGTLTDGDVGAGVVSPELDAVRGAGLFWFFGVRLPLFSNIFQSVMDVHWKIALFWTG